MNDRIRNKLAQSKRRIGRRLDKYDNSGSKQPMLTAANIHYEVADRTRAIAAGGIGAVHLLARRLGLAEAIDRELHLLEIHMPYHESDHVLNIAYNLLTGGNCLELRRNDEVYLEALSARRPKSKWTGADPTTAGDFCRRFIAADVDTLQEVFNEVRLKVWRQQPDRFFDEAVIEADDTMVETTGECKGGMDINHKGGVRSLTAPVDNLLSNWAYMVTVGLAWSLKAWTTFLLPESGRWQEKHREEKWTLLRMDFATFRNAIIQMPAQIIRGGRRIVYRLLSWNRWQPVFFRLLDQLRLPLRC